jgi:hypothetical protein
MSSFPNEGTSSQMLNWLTSTPSENVAAWMLRTMQKALIASAGAAIGYSIKMPFRKTAAEQPGVHSRWRQLRKARIALLTVSFGLVVADAISHQFWGAVSGGPLGQLGVVGLLATAIIGLVERNTRIKADTNAAEGPSLVTTDAKTDKP